MLIIEAFALGFAIKVVTGIDDMLTRVPIIATLAKTRRGKVSFSLGAICAVCAATAIAYFFSGLIQTIPSYKNVVAVLIIGLAIAIKFDLFVHRPQEKVKQKIKTKLPDPSLEKLTKLFLIGFVASFTTVLDDVIAYLPIFFGEPLTITFGVAGIVIATICQATVVILFAEQIAKIPYKEEIAAGGLVILAILILFGVL